MFDAQWYIYQKPESENTQFILLGPLARIEKKN